MIGIGIRSRSASVASLLSAFIVAFAAGAPPAGASHQLGAVYAYLQAKQPRQGFYAGFSEDYTDFGTLELEGEEVPNESNQFLHGSISQVVLGYQFDRRVGVQLNVPYVDRSFRRPEGEAVVRGSESGLGDLSLVAHWRVIEREEGGSVVLWTLLGGVKFPTGDSDRLAEELEEDHHGEETEAALPRAATAGSDVRAHHEEDEEEEHGEEVASGVHGHDLALGSGSTDAIVGSSVFFARGRFLLDLSLQYALRTEGDFGYRYANDLTWTVTPAFLAARSPDRSVGLGLSVAGEHKGEDEVGGEPLDDTAVDAVYAGPALDYWHRDRFFAELRFELPVSVDHSGLQMVPDWRLRLGLAARF